MLPNDWELKEGLYEYATKRLTEEERLVAIERINKKFSQMDPELKALLQV